jgi:hypothetical protein
VYCFEQTKFFALVGQNTVCKTAPAGGQYDASGNGFYLANYSFTDGSGDVYDTYLRALTGIRP